MSNLSYDDYLDPRDIDELLQIRATDYQNMFRIGDIAERNWQREKVRLTREKGSEESGKMFIYSAVSTKCGRSARTVRYYNRVSTFYPPNTCAGCGATILRHRKQEPCCDVFLTLREKYEDLLSFSHLSRAIQFPDWVAFLEYCMTGGPGGTVVRAELAEAYWRGEYVPPQSDEPIDWDAKLAEILENSSTDFTLRGVVKYFRGIFSRFSLSPQADSKLQQALALLGEVAEEVERVDETEKVR